jgi:rubrerythrin
MGDALALLISAIELEKDGYKFYNEAAKKTTDAKGKAIFEQLAKDEIEHEKVLAAEFESLQKTGQFFQHQQTQLAKIYKPWNRPKIFSADSEAKNRIKANTTDLEAIRIAIQNEKKAVDFFAQARESSQEPLAKKLYTRLTAEEESHVVLLEGEYDYLANAGFWLGHQEFTMEHA